jgi:hypothetical protein
VVGLNILRRGAQQLQYPVQLQASLLTLADSDNTSMIGDANSLSREAPADVLGTAKLNLNI